ncbi:hypothetical protein BESB_006460 [Besnoitia besnoiti]|uniref:Sphingomyelin synthase-like domain-containing protein n=1 Tax=Besnoitia besnoiti TaxID=94643 RepID=A0A2A9MK02_BESBE|nr:hypothetical protein BESB_006460 [Besnoitia besnoiti]PFH38305.1 hypothetical protein BESB_006460 [Besnoitia besnoiti]
MARQQESLFLPPAKKGLTCNKTGEKERIPALWATSHSTKFYFWRVVATGLYFTACIYVMCLCSVASDTFFDPRTQKSLPDRIHDQMLESKPLFFATPLVVDVVTVSLIVVTIFRHICFLKMPLNLMYGARFLFLLGTLYLCRGMAIIITTVPPSTRNCVPPPVTSVASFFYLGVLQVFSMRTECTGMIISGHSTVTCCCLASWLLYGNANREDRDTKAVPFYELLRFLGRVIERLRGAIRKRRGAGYITTPVTDLEENAENGSRGVNVEDAPSASILAAEREEEDRRKTLWSGILRLNLLRSLCLCVGVINLGLIVTSFNHYSIDVFMAVNYTFATWTLYHCVLSLIWAEKEEENKRQTIALLKAEAAAAVDEDGDSISEASTSASVEGSVLVPPAPTLKKRDMEKAVKPQSSNTPCWLAALNFPIIRVGVRIIKAVEGL